MVFLIKFIIGWVLYFAIGAMVVALVDRMDGVVYEDVVSIVFLWPVFVVVAIGALTVMGVMKLVKWINRKHER